MILARETKKLLCHEEKNTKRPKILSFEHSSVINVSL